jgi:lysophospholipase L1-like esterase
MRLQQLHYPPKARFLDGLIRSRRWCSRWRLFGSTAGCWSRYLALYWVVAGLVVSRFMPPAPRTHGRNFVYFREEIFHFGRMIKPFLLFSTILLSCSTMSFAQDAAPPVLATTPELHAKTEARIEQFNKISKEGTAELVFLGDSITQGWEGKGKEVWAKYYGQRKAANFGIGGDCTEHVLWRMDHGNFDGLKPKLVVLMIGTNNTGHRKDKPEDTAAGVKAIITKLQTKCPGVKVLLLGIFPRGAKPDDAGRQLNTKINDLLKPMADGKTVHYMDIGAKFLEPDGTMTKEMMPDFLHPGPKGYQIWADAIDETLSKLLGEPQ